MIKGSVIQFLLSQVRTSKEALIGGKVYFYQPGTVSMTGIKIWLDEEATSAANNPYTLDADATAQIYASGKYRIVIKDALGVTQFDRDNIMFFDFDNPYEYDALQYSPNTFTQASITAALTAIGTSNKATLLFRPGTWPIISNADWSAYTNVTFKIVPGAVISHGAFTVKMPYPEYGLYTMFAGSGAVTFNPGSFESVSPIIFGFGSATSAANNKLAIDYAVTSLGPSLGGLIRFPAGSFAVAPGIVPGKKNVHFQGSGTAHGYEANTPGTTLVFTVGTYGFDLRGGVAPHMDSAYTNIENIAIDGDGVLDYGVWINGVQQLNNVSVTDCSVAGVSLGDYINTTRLDRVSLFKNTGYGFLANGISATVWSMTNSNIRENIGVGARICTGYGANMENVVIESNTGVGLEIYQTDASYGIRYFTFDRVWVENNNIGTTGYNVTISAQTPANGPVRLTFNDFYVAQTGAAKGVEITALHFSDIKNMVAEGGDTTHAIDIVAATGEYNTFKDSTTLTTDTGVGNLRVTLGVTGLVFTREIIATSFSTVSALSTVTASGVAVTLFSALPEGVYFLSVYLPPGGGAGNATIIASATIISDGTAVALRNYEAGDIMTITLSGTNVQATQSSGNQALIKYKYIKL